MGLRRRMMMMQDAGDILPPEYQKVEYLEATGRQYINTGIIPKNTEILYAEFQYTGIYGGYPTIYGCGSSPDQNSLAYFYQSGLIFLRNNTGYVAKNIGEYNTEKRTSYVVMNGDKPEALCLFSGRQGNNSSKARFFIFIWYSTDSNITNKLIPCYRKADNKPGMYDIVTGEFLINAGTGDFIVGADV